MERQMTNTSTDLNFDFEIFWLKERRSQSLQMQNVEGCIYVEISVVWG